MKKIKRLVALLLCMIMLVSAFSTLVFAEDESIEQLVTQSEIKISLCEFDYYMGECVFNPETSKKYQFDIDSPYSVDISIMEFENGAVDYESDFFVYNWFENGKGKMYANLEAGKSYYIEISSIEQQKEFSVNLSVQDAPSFTGIEISSFPYETLYYSTYIDDINFYGLELLATMSNGETTTIGIYDDGYDIEYDIQLDKNKKDYGKVTINLEGCTTSFMIEIKENPVSKIEYVGNPIEIVENTNCYEVDGTVYYLYEEFFMEENDVFKVTFKNGKVEFYDSYETIEGLYMIETYANQYEKPWKTGGKNYIDVEYAGVKTKIPVTILPSPVKEITINKAPSYVYTYGDLNDGMFYGENYSFKPVHIDDLEFTVTFNDGSKKSYTGEDIDLLTGTLDGESFELIYDFEDAWPGKHDIEFNFNGKKAFYTVTLKDSDVKSVKLVKGIEKTKYDVGFIPDFTGCEFKVTFKDGKSKTVKVTEDNLYYAEKDAYIVEDKKVIAAIYSEETEKENNLRFSFYYYGKTCKIVDAVYENQPLYTEISFKNVSENLKNIKLTAIKADGTKDTYTLKNNQLDKYLELAGAKIDISEILSLINIGIYYVKTDRGVFNASVMLIKEGDIFTEYIGTAFDISVDGVINENVVLDKISVEELPYKTRYFKGEKFDPKGLVIATEYKQGLEGSIIYGVDEEIEISEVNTSKLGKKTVTVSYKGKKTTFEIEVTNGFSDIKKGAWYEEYVNFAYSYGIFEGTDKTKNTFAPDMKMTRAQIVQILANIDGINTQDNNVNSGFKDVAKNKWYTAAVKWASENGIVSGTGDGNFRPEDNVTREQLCLMLTNYIENYYGGMFFKETAKTEFADDDSISSWAKDAVYTCQRAGIISGIGDGNFAPKETATRAQGATVFATFAEKYMLG